MTRVRPIPSPPWDFSSERSTWVKSSKTWGSISRGIPMPVSLTATTISPSRRSAVSAIRPPSSVYFALLLSRFAKTWARRVGSASRGIGPGGRSTVRAWRGALDERPARLHGVLHDRGQVDPLLAELELAPGDPRDIEQVVDQSHHLADLAFHHRAGRLDDLGLAVGQADDLERVADRRQRVPQFVRQGREELVLAAIGVAKLLVEAGVLDRDRGHLRELKQDRLVIGGELTPDAIRKLDRPDHSPVAGEEGDGEQAS